MPATRDERYSPPAALPTPPRASVFATVWLIGATIILLGIAVGLHAWFETVDGLRPVPWLGRLPWVLSGVAAVPLAAQIRRVMMRRSAAVLAVFVAHLVVSVGGACGVLLSDDDFLFGYTLLDSAEADDGGRLYLYKGGLFCDVVVRRAEPGDVWSWKMFSIHQKNCVDLEARILLDGEHPVIVGPDGEELIDRPGPLDGLFVFH